MTTKWTEWKVNIRDEDEQSTQNTSDYSEQQIGLIQHILYTISDHEQQEWKETPTENQTQNMHKNNNLITRTASDHLIRLTTVAHKYRMAQKTIITFSVTWTDEKL